VHTLTNHYAHRPESAHDGHLILEESKFTNSFIRPGPAEEEIGTISVDVAELDTITLV